MSPSAIPWILCGAFCLVPLLIGTGSFFAWCQLTDRIPSREVSIWVDDEGRKHTRTELVMLTREERKFRDKPEEQE
jgi:hypothetical protein